MVGDDLPLQELLLWCAVALEVEVGVSGSVMSMLACCS
jgi:hypothetical protein